MRCCALTLPILEPVCVMIRSTATDKHNSHQVESKDEQDLQAGKGEFQFAIDADEKDVAGDQKQSEYGNPYSVVHVGPKIDDDSCSNKLGGQSHHVAVYLIPSVGKAKCWIEEVLSMANDATTEWNKGAHFCNGQHWSGDKTAHEEVPKEGLQ